MNIKRLGVGFAFAGALFALTGCGSVVYKDAATTYVVAGKAATRSLTDAATNLAAAQDRLKATRIVGDASCPIGEKRIFLRDPRYRGVFTAALKRIPEMAGLPACIRLEACEANPAAPGCNTACYSAQEANCIDQLETNTALRQKSLSGADADRFAEGSKPLVKALDELEYGRSAPVQNKLVKSSVDALLDYLDLLDKLTKKRESEVAGDAKKLSDKITNASKEITDLTGKQLSAADKATQAQITGAIGALGKFVSDMQDIAANAADADAIRKLVAARSSDVQALVVSIKEVAIGDAMLAAVYKDIANAQARADLQARYAGARDAYERSLVLAERDKYTYTDGEQLKSSVGALFDAMDKSHAALVQLVLHPDDKDLQAISNARFQEFKTIAADVVAIAQLFS